MPTELLRPPASRSRLILRGCLALCASLALGAAFAAPHAAGKAPADSAKTVAKAKPKAKPNAKAKAKAKAKATPNAKKRGTAKAAAGAKPGPLAQFRGTSASPEVVHVANWASYTHDAGRRAFVVIDKNDAQLYLFDPQGKLKGHTQVLLGKAVGDTVAPGAGNKPLSQLKESEKTTPAGRFLVGQGKNNHGDNVLWIDYAAAISMHRMHSVSASERRAQRMATPDPGDNRISNGCVNVPHAFYDRVLRPTVLKQGAIVYVLPETRTPQQLFGSYDVPAGKHGTAVAQHAGPSGKPGARS